MASRIQFTARAPARLHAISKAIAPKVQHRAVRSAANSPNRDSNIRHYRIVSFTRCTGFNSR